MFQPLTNLLFLEVTVKKMLNLIYKKGQSRVFFKIIILIFIVTFTGYGYSWAEEKKTNKSPQNTTIKNKGLNNKKIESQYDIRPFNLTVEKLPPNYKGHDIKKLYHELEKKKIPDKDEFETQEAYTKRTQSLFSAVPKDFYAFKVVEFAYFNYDAESQMIEIQVPTDYSDIQRKVLEKGIHDSIEGGYDLRQMEQMKKGYMKRKNLILIRRVDEGKSTYIASNSFGVKTKVTQHRQTLYDLELDNRENFWKGLRNKIGERVIKINMPPHEAKNLKENFGLLLICRLSHLTDPYRNISNDLSHLEPTLDEPEEYYSSMNFVSVELLEIWVYHIKSGKIFVQEKVEQAE